MFNIYEIENTITGFKYIGCSNHIQRRWKEHIRELRSNKHRNKHLQNAWNKHGEESFNFKIISEYDDENIMFLEEKKLIENSDNLYNMADGGLGGNTYRGLSEEEYAKRTKALSENLLKRFQDPNERRKANCFVNLSEEEYNNRTKVWSEAKKGSKNNKYKHSSPVLQIDPMTKEVVKVWKDACEAAEVGYNREYIVNCCQNKKGYKSHKKFYWQWQIQEN